MAMIRARRRAGYRTSCPAAPVTGLRAGAIDGQLWSNLAAKLEQST
jgi:hypothetical protein